MSDNLTPPIKGYPLSTDYGLLRILIEQGYRIPAWVPREFSSSPGIYYWVIVEVKCSEGYRPSIGTQGVGYESYSIGFEATCEELNLHYIMPTIE